MKYRPEIDGVRAIAIGGVLLFHVNESWLPGGFLGVDVFFVISGYLIIGQLAESLENGRFSFVDFYARRIRRLLPAATAVLAATYIAALIVLSPVDFEAFARSLIANAFFASNWFFYSQVGYFDVAANLKPLLHTWSLAIEEQFYFLIPALMFFAFRWRRSSLPHLLFAVTIVSLFYDVMLSSAERSAGIRR